MINGTEKAVNGGNIDQINGTATHQGLLQRLEASKTSAAMELSCRSHGQGLSLPVTVNVSQSSVSSSSNPFSIDRILQPRPSRTVRPWSADIEGRSWNKTTWTAAAQHSSNIHQHLTAWSSNWPVNYVSTAQQFGYPSVNISETGEIIILYAIIK